MSAHRDQSKAPRAKNEPRKRHTSCKEDSHSFALDRKAALLLGRRSADDDAWYECEASIELENSTALGGLKEVLRTQLHGAEASDCDFICTAKEARARLRPLCRMLQQGLCSQMKVGEVVLARRTCEVGPFYEACLKQIHRKRHSLQAPCKCKFDLVWMDKSMKGVQCTAPGSRIRQHGQVSIANCPMLSKWLHSTENIPPEANSVEDDWISVLERELCKITIIAENLSLKEFSAENLTGASDPNSTFTKFESKQKAKPQGVLSRGSKRDLTGSRTLIKEGMHQDLKPCLTPLAARAAFASMLSQNSSYPKSEDKSKVQTSPCMELRKSVIAAHLATGTASLEVNLPKPTKTYKPGELSQEPQSKSKPTSHERCKPKVHLLSGCRVEGIGPNCAQTILPSKISTSEKASKTSAGMPSEEQSCKRARPINALRSAGTHSVKHTSCSKNGPSASKRDRQIEMTNSMKDGPSAEEIPLATKRLKRTSSRAFKRGTSMEEEGMNLLANKTLQSQPTVSCNLRSHKHFAEKRLSGPSSPKSHMTTPSPSSAGMKMKQVPSLGWENKDSLGSPNNKLIKKGVDKAANLKEDLEQKDDWKRQRTRSRSARHSNVVSRMACQVVISDQESFKWDKLNQGSLKLKCKQLQVSTDAECDCGSGSSTYSSAKPQF